MRQIIFLLLLSISLDLRASDFRGINLGESCSQIIGLEISKGSTQIIPNFLTFKGVFYYKGILIGDNHTISYVCDELENLKFVFVKKENETLQDANSYMTNLTKIISSFHGDPALAIPTQEWKEAGMKDYIYWDLDKKLIQLRFDNSSSKDVIWSLTPKSINDLY